MKVISLINMKGGVAKTTLAVNIADCLARRHEARVLLVDVDPQFNATQCLMSPESYVKHLEDGSGSILSVFDRSHRVSASTAGDTTNLPPKQLEEIELVRVPAGFDLLPGNLELIRLEMAPGEGRENRLKNYLLKMEENYDFVIIDTPPTPSIWMTSALIASDYYLIPVKADPLSLTGIDLLKGIIDERKDNFGLKLSCAGLVLTLAEPHTLVFQNAERNLKKDKYWKRHLYAVSLPKRTAIAKSQLEQTQILSGTNAEAKHSLTRITNELLERVNGNE